MSTVLPAMTGGILSDIISWVRRIIKSPSPTSISDITICDYINRFYVYDMSERVQLFELKRQYTFETIPNIFEYQAPFQSIINPTTGAPLTNGIPQYQMFLPPIYCDGVEMGWYQSNEQFYNLFPEFVNNEQPIMGAGNAGPYTVTFGQQPVLRGFTDDLGNLEPYVYITAIGTSGNLIYVVDDGKGNLLQTDATFQVGLNSRTPAPIVGTVDYINGIATFTLNSDTIPITSVIQTQTSPFSSGFPRICLFFNNIFKLFPVPSRTYKIQVDAYVTPSQFMTTGASIPFSYMSEYIARGASRKILSDNADYDQFQFYEPLFKEQENLVLRRSDRQRAVERTPTIFTSQTQNNPFLFTQY